LEADEAYEAVVKLLEGNGVYCAADDVSVKKVITPAGHTLYVAMSRRQLRVRSGGSARIGYATLVLGSTLEVDRALPSVVLSTHRSR
jgi:hypothetical protein